MEVFFFMSMIFLSLDCVHIYIYVLVLQDGSFQEARFNNPQGVCWLDSDSFIVCDTGNHLLRKVNLESKTVETFAGTGVQTEFGDQGEDIIDQI